MKIQDFIKATNKEGKRIRPIIVCNDGFSMSVQASEFHYSTPRYDNLDFYSAFEIGYPSEIEHSIINYAEDKEHPINTVYSWVPYEIIDIIIDKHGGINKAETFNSHLA